VNEAVLLVHVERGEDGQVGVRSPRVGVWSGIPSAGALVGPGSPLGTLAVLNRRYVLVLPEGAGGRIAGPLPPDRAAPIEFGQLLFRLAPVAAGASGLPEGAEPAEAPGRSGLSPGTWAVVSPTDGVFYRHPSPEGKPFVDVGSRVRTGQPLGLVEVMKTFNPILYGGPGLPEEAEVIEIRCGDSADVRAGQILMVVRQGPPAEPLPAGPPSRGI
jgi:biotin carboxyl carrier protein